MHAGVATGPGPSAVQKLGLYEYFVDESTPVVYNGRMVMFESIVRSSPEWAGNWIPAFANCSCYYRVRDIIKGVVLTNITETCDHAFGSALVTAGASGQTFWVFGTPWIRDNVFTGTAGWSGPCSQGDCSVNVFWSTDPQLQSWQAGPGAPLAKGLVVYNNDVTPVSASPSRQQAAGLPPHQWVMAIETGAEYTNFLVSNNSDPTGGWTALDPTVYVVPKFGRDIGSCPSVRYVASTGYYYVLTGGNTIYILRSTNLKDWELAQDAVLSPSAADCAVAAPFFGNYTPSAEAQAHIARCSGSGFGNDSDVDLVEWLSPLTNATAVLLQYGSGDQATFGFSNLATYPGSLDDFLAAFFPSQ